MEINLRKMATENRNPRTLNIDKMTSVEIAKAMNREDKEVPKAIEKEVKKIGKLIDLAYNALLKDGRVIYMGAGTSGRLGVLDASECPPTFGVTPNTFVGLMAGGPTALVTAVEGAEDSKTFAVEDLKRIKLTKKDVVIGVAASGRTPYVVGGLDYAHKVGCKTGSITCNKGSEISKHADVAVEVVVGPEVLTGSTRLKAGTAQKLVLNMVSTGSMVKLGKTYFNLMVDMVPTNDKLHVRAENIVMDATGCSRAEAKKALKKTGDKVKVAIVMILNKCDEKEAKKALIKAKGHVRAALK